MERFLSFFRVPVLDDPVRAESAALLYRILAALLGVLLIVPLATLILTPSEFWIVALLAAVMLVVTVVLMLLVRRGHVEIVGLLLTLSFWAATTLSVVPYRGVRDLAVTGYFLVIVLGTLLLGLRGALGFFLLCTLSVLALYLAETEGWIVPQIEASAPLFQVIVLVITLGLTAMLLRSAVRTIAQNVERTRRTAEALAESNRRAEASRLALEARTRELEHRTVQLQAAAEIGRAAASILEPERLIQQAAELIRERFALYHVALCLVDETGEFARYRAGAGVGAAELLEEGVRFALGDSSMIGWCIANAQVRVAQGARLDTVRLDHPLIPDTRSEAAFPLITRGEVLGALDVQSDRVAAFDESTLAALQLIADQLAVALSNARLYAASQEALEMTRRVYGELGSQAWRQLLRQRGEVGYVYARKQVKPLEGEWDPEMARAAEAAETAWGEGRRSVAVPLRVRGRVVGAFQLRKEQGEAAWTDEEVQLIETLADRMGLALESARLYQETQDRAAREQLVREITNRMRRAVDMESLLRITAQELREALDVPEAFVQLTAPPVKGEGTRQT